MTHAGSGEPVMLLRLGDDVLLNAIKQAIERSRIALANGSRTCVRFEDSHASLTPRERELWHWVVSGLLNKQIAAKLDTSEITVKAHRGRVMRKMRVDLAELARVAAALDVPRVAHP